MVDCVSVCAGERNLEYRMMDVDKVLSQVQVVNTKSASMDDKLNAPEYLLRIAGPLSHMTTCKVRHLLLIAP